MMTLVEKIGVGIMLGMILAAGCVAQRASADMNTSGRWIAEQGFIVTSPLGERYACEIGLWTPEFEPDEVSLVCVPFEDPKRYKGHKDGELELIE